MAKRGRKKKHGLRTPSGHLSRSAAAIIAKGERDIAMAQPHRRWLPQEARSEQRAENVLGRLFLAGKITEPQCWAGEAWRRLAADFGRVLASPVRPNSALSSMVDSGLELPAEADHLSSSYIETPEEKSDRVLDRYDGAMRALDRAERSVAGFALKVHLQDRLFPVLDDVVVQDREPSPAGLQKLVLLLDTLAKHWGLCTDEERPFRAQVNERPKWGHDEKEVLISYGAKPALAR